MMDNSMSPADFAAMTNGNGWGNDGGWWLILLFLFAFNGWGGGYGYGNGGTGEEGGNSMRGRYYRDGYAREGSYEGNSYRKRNRMGQFSRYFRDGEKEQLIEKLDTLMDDTTNGGDRQELRQSIMEIMNKYK